jgi:hypothetical protein
MIDERVLELIHGDIDGINTPEEQQELRRHLMASEAVRHEHARMRELDRLLTALPLHEPPPGLRNAILARVNWRPGRSWAGRRNWFAPALGMAAALAGVTFLLFTAPRFPELDRQVLGGTFARSSTAVSSMRVDEHLVSGGLTLRADGRGLVLELDLRADQPLSVVARGRDAPLVLRGVVPIDGSPAAISIEDGSIRVLHEGRQRYALLLDAGSGAALDIRIYDGSQLISRQALGL